MNGARRSTAAFQGEAGAFSEEAAIALLGPTVEAIGHATFEDVVYATSSGAVDFGVLPIENSTYGQIATNYDLLLKYRRVSIVGTTSRPIDQALLGMQGSNAADLESVASHPVALDQCTLFFERHPRIEREAVHDTAGAVRLVLERNDPRRGAIGPAWLAERYGVDVLAERIQDNPDNRTRFLLLSCDQDSLRMRATRACIALDLRHEVGSLRMALSAFEREGLNLTSIASRPSPRGPFDYRFYVELEAQVPFDTSILTAMNGVTLLGAY